MSRTLLPLAGFEVTLNGRFWVTAEGRLSLLGAAQSSVAVVAAVGDQALGADGWRAKATADD